MRWKLGPLSANARGSLVAAVAMGVLLGGSCGPHAPASMVPANYRATFTRTRNCRLSTEHAAPAGQPLSPSGLANIVVWVSPDSAAAYDANANPLGAGTLVIKEEFDGDDSSCSGPVLAWSVAHKEPGFAPAHGDWHWQHVLANGTIDADGDAQRCNNSGCHGTPECLARDWMCTQP